MNIFSRIFGLGNKDKRNYEDKTPYKIQIMRKALVRRDVKFGTHVYSVHVPARLVGNYQDALIKKAKKAVLTPLEKTYLTGYLNPAYRYATEPRKRKQSY